MRDRNYAPAGAKGDARKRTAADPIKRHMQSSRPRTPDDLQGWVGYRTEACLAFNLATAAGASPEVVALIRVEYETAVEALQRLAPHILEELAAAAAEWREEPIPAPPPARAPVQLSFSWATP